MQGVRTVILDNGTKVLLKKLFHTKKTFILVGFKTGSIDETKDNAGLRHLVEHMLFKSKAARKTVEELEHNGAIVNAFTSLHETGFHLKVSSLLAPAALRTVFQMFINRESSAKEFEKEKGVVLDEVENDADVPIYKSRAIILPGVLFGDTSMGRPIEGFFETVSKLTENDIHEVLDNFYVPNNSVIIVVGRFDEPEILKTINETFGTLPLSPKKVEHFYPKIEISNTRTIKVVKRSGSRSQIYICLGYKLPGLHELRPDIFKLKVLDAIFSAGMSSRFFIELREKRVIGYGVGTLFDDNIPASAFYAYIDGFYKRRFNLAIKTIVNQFNALKINLVEERELERAKNQLISQYEDILEELDYTAISLMQREFHKIPYDFTRLPSYIKKVCPEDLRDVARRYLTDDYTLTALVPEDFDLF